MARLSKSKRAAAAAADETGEHDALTDGVLRLGDEHRRMARLVLGDDDRVAEEAAAALTVDQIFALNKVPATKVDAIIALLQAEASANESSDLPFTVTDEPSGAQAILSRRRLSGRVSRSALNRAQDAAVEPNNDIDPETGLGQAETEALRAMVRDMVREALKGEIGERLGAGIKRLIRREVQALLALDRAG